VERARQLNRGTSGLKWEGATWEGAREGALGGGYLGGCSGRGSWEGLLGSGLLGRGRGGREIAEVSHGGPFRGHREEVAIHGVAEALFVEL
jgi:hypothetical protein